MNNNIESQQMVEYGKLMSKSLRLVRKMVININKSECGTYQDFLSAIKTSADIMIESAKEISDGKNIEALKLMESKGGDLETFMLRHGLVKESLLEIIELFKKEIDICFDFADGIENLDTMIEGFESIEGMDDFMGIKQ